MKIQRFGFDYNDDKRTIVFVCNDGEMINYKDHEAKMQQALRIIKKLRGERALWIKRCKQVSKHHPDTLILDE